MKDYQKARSYYEKACNLHVRDGCYNLGVIYYNGQGVRQNFQMAKEYLGQACDLGQQDGCDAYKMLNEKGY
ncbi:MAG: sel1 repeat family protein [Butyrivibrio sp.]|nr:sel1 repeat family protein [Butyrivibrio sp.]